MYIPRGGRWFAAAIAGAFFAAAESPAADFAVTNTTNAGAGSLRQAITDANNAAGPDRVVFDAGVAGTILLTGGQITITDAVEILGPGADVLTISGNDASRIFLINAGPVTIEDLRFRDGFANASPGGGAIHVNGTTLTCRYCEFRDNVSDSATLAYGGALSTLNSANLVLENCLFVGNRAGGGNVAFGGAIRQASGSFTATNCTFSGNIAAGSTESYGGGASIGGAPLRMTHCTFTLNDVVLGLGRGAGLYYAGGGTFNVRSSIFAANVGASNMGRSTGTYVSECYNLDADGGSNWSTGGCDLVGSAGTPLDAGLLPLANNGGTMASHALLETSIALDAGGPGDDVLYDTLIVDQRGQPRPVDGDCDATIAADIGAYEQQTECGCTNVRGDANCDGNVNFFDIDPFVLALFDPSAYQTLFCGGDACGIDLDCSGAINFFDIDPFLDCVFFTCPPCP